MAIATSRRRRGRGKNPTLLARVVFTSIPPVLLDRCSVVNIQQSVLIDKYLLLADHLTVDMTEGAPMVPPPGTEPSPRSGWARVVRQDVPEVVVAESRLAVCGRVGQRQQRPELGS